MRQRSPRTPYPRVPPQHLFREPHIRHRTVRSRRALAGELHWIFHRLTRINGKQWKCHFHRRNNGPVNKERKKGRGSITVTRRHIPDVMYFLYNRDEDLSRPSRPMLLGEGDHDH